MRLQILVAGLLMAAATPAFAADPVEGVWLTESGSGKVMIAPCPGQPNRMCGRLTWLKNAAEQTSQDTHNPDAALKTRSILGMPMLWNFKQASPGKWTGGKIYDPNSGKTYDSKISFAANGALKVEGCILVVCQAQAWRRG